MAAEQSSPVEFREQVRRVLKVAHDRGVDRVLALDDAGLLWSAQREVAVRADTLRKAAEFFEERSLDALAGRGKAPATANATKALIVSILRELGAS
jgi:hypothetical protein